MHRRASPLPYATASFQLSKRHRQVSGGSCCPQNSAPGEAAFPGQCKEPCLPMKISVIMTLVFFLPLSVCNMIQVREYSQKMVDNAS